MAAPLPPLPSPSQPISGAAQTDAVWFRWFKRNEEIVRELQATIATQAATITTMQAELADHEARITALEP